MNSTDSARGNSSSPIRTAYIVDSIRDVVTGQVRLRVKVVYRDGAIRPLPPRFQDEAALQIYIARWNPELVGKRIADPREDFDEE